MFEKFLTWIKRVMGKLTNEKGDSDFLPVVSEEMAVALELYSAVYRNKAPWLDKDTESLNLAAAISSEIARMVTIELKTEITGSPRAEYLNAQYARFIANLRTYVEYACALGGIVFKPYICGRDIAVDVVQANRFCPMTFNSAGDLTAANFMAQVIRGREINTRLELHETLERGYHISNAAYRSMAPDVLGTPIDLTEVAQWADLTPDTVFSGVETPMFAYFKVAQANTVDLSSPLGVSVFARAVDLIRHADEQYSRLLWEFKGGELAIDADISLFGAIEDGRDSPTLPKGKERLFRALNFNVDKTPMPMTTFAPVLRDQSLINGLNEILMRIEDQCGLARGTFSDPRGEARTATELKILQQKSYATVADNQKSLESALRNLVCAMDSWATIGKLAPEGDYEVTFAWDDSIIVDSEGERQALFQEESAGIISTMEYIKRRFGIEDEEVARKMMPEMQEIVRKDDAVT